MLFQERHIPMIENNEKTETRRRISRFKSGPKKGKVVPPLKVGSVQPCTTRMFGKARCYILILGCWPERLGSISVLSARREGNYTPEEYIKGVIEMYDNQIDENEVMWVYRFQFKQSSRSKTDFARGSVSSR